MIAVYDDDRDPQAIFPLQCWHCDEQWTAVAPVGTLLIRLPCCERWTPILVTGLLEDLLEEIDV